MRRPALNADPLSYSKTLQSLRAGEASALTTGLGSVSLVGFDIHRLPSGSFVPQHISEHRPARILNGFRHPSFGELGGIHIANDDQAIRVSQALAGDVEMMAPSVSDLGMDRLDAMLISGALSLANGVFISAIVLQSWDFDSVAACGERLEAEINSDLSAASLQTVCDLTLKADIPSATRVLNEATSLELAINVPVLPKSETALEVDYSITVNANCARDERYPSKSASGPEAGAEAWTAAMSVARCGKLATGSLNGVAMNPKIGGNANAQIYQVESTRPPCRGSKQSAFLGFALRGDAEVPDLVTGDCVASQVLGRHFVFDPKFVGDEAHG